MTNHAEVDALADMRAVTSDMREWQSHTGFNSMTLRKWADRIDAALIRAREAVVTEEMAARAYDVYRKVVDSGCANIDHDSIVAMRAALLAILPLPSDAQALERVRAFIATLRGAPTMTTTWDGVADELERALGDKQ